jgi:serine/threonine-protein kinase
MTGRCAGSSVKHKSRRSFDRRTPWISTISASPTTDRFYYVMELLDGFDLDTLVRRFGPVPAARAIAFLRQICHSLNEAESYGLVHRDMKPANIVVCRYGADDDFIKVLDFGIAKGTNGMLDTIALTRDELFRGTPAFIAPEQVIGNTVDGRADLYAVGCVAYWLLTGELVFTGHNAMKVMLDHAHRAPLPPSARSEQAIPPELDRIVLDCLAKNPDDRPQTAKELAARLSAVPGADDWTEALAREWWNTHHAETRVSKAEDFTPGLTETVSNGSC